MGRISDFFKKRYHNVKRDVNAGLGTSFLKDTGKMTWEMGRDLFKRKPVQAETFDAAKVRLQLTDADLQERMKMLRMHIAIFSFSAMVALGYAIYLGITGEQYISVFITMLVSIILICYAFKSHFWLFQIKHKKLGCTIEEWLNSSIKELN